MGVQACSHACVCARHTRRLAEGHGGGPWRPRTRRRGAARCFAIKGGGKGLHTVLPRAAGARRVPAINTKKELLTMLLRNYGKTSLQGEMGAHRTVGASLGSLLLLGIKVRKRWLENLTALSIAVATRSQEHLPSRKPKDHRNTRT